MRRRLLAIVALLAAAATIALAVAVAVGEFPRGLLLLACVLIAGAAAWYGALRRGLARVVGLIVAGLGLAGALVLLVTRGAPLVDLLVVGGLLVSLAAARAAFTVHVDLPSASAPRQPVLVYNPKSGGGKAERFALVQEAGRRGIEAVELRRGDDLEALVRAAVARGADGLAMAGGDGSQAVVAAVAAELGLPYACIPAGTRNHFALDLGVDRDDVVGALDAFVDGGERWVDLGEVNGRVFVNNVSIGVYAEAVQHEGYRDAKIRTVLDTVPDILGPTGDKLDLGWRGPGGHKHRGGAACSCPTTPTGLATRSARARAPGLTTACSGSPFSVRSRGRMRKGARYSVRGVRGLHLPSRSVRTSRSPPASTAKPWSSMRRWSSASDPRSCECTSPAGIRAPRPRPWPPRESAKPWSDWCESPSAGARNRRRDNTEEVSMDLMEIKEKERLSREDAAARLHALADALARHNEVEFVRGDLRFTVHVPDEVDFKLEIEIGEQDRELEIELTW